MGSTVNTSDELLITAWLDSMERMLMFIEDGLQKIIVNAETVLRRAADPCPICLDSMTPASYIMCANNHCVHKVCFTSFAAYQNDDFESCVTLPCPLCRAPIDLPNHAGPA